MFSSFTYPKHQLEMFEDFTGSGKSNMVAFKSEVPISKLVDKIGTKVERKF